LSEAGIINSGRVLSLLGLARRAGVLLIGQDQVLDAIGSRHPGLLVLTVQDCSPNVLRKLEGFDQGQVVCGALEGVDRGALGRSLGIRSAQIAALPIKSGFAKKLAVLLRQEGPGIDE
jgi:ribosomal protein L7Ae-like RNA K-turn-binding protein